ncbi:MAG: insulinase family protein, partial [Sediminibacterium sp.]|nr:insulinase family protein [Sediminibacterium sp.]
MKLMRFLFVVLLATGVQCVSAQKKYEWKQATAAGYTYKYVTNDPIHARFYTLKNGLTVVLSPNKTEPRLTVKIPVRAGSNTDPRDHTGLAHYLEHMVFKGTDKFGSLDWAKEKPLLDKIDGLYEQYNKTTDPAKRKEIYAEIDKTSGEAAKYSIANEYDKMMKAMGGQGSNAHTFVEETVYEEDIPSNAVEKFLDVQSERFRNPILRIFHTELEAVYEEKNRGLDNDANKMQEAMFYNLFPTHNYGQQTTIGTIEHLKNPSLTAIRDYYYKYYVPNNMAIVISGDMDPDKLIKMIDEKFAYMKPKPVEEYKPAPEKPLVGPIVKDIYGPSAENMRILYRTAAAGTHEAMLADLLSSVLSNGKAGLLDLNLNKQQKVLSASAGTIAFKDYGVFIVAASPKQGQTLEEVKDLLMAQLAIVKKGDFDESLLKAIVANSKLSQLQGLESNNNRASTLTDQFIKNKGNGWDKSVAELDEMAKITKKELVDFTNSFLSDKNYVLLYKRKGEDKSIVKVEKPAITPVETNPTKQSPFVKMINEKPLLPSQPLWLDFTKDFQKAKVGNAEVFHVLNKDNSLTRMYYRFSMGSWNNKVLPLALQYLQFLGTDKYTAEQISKEFYNLACNFNATAATEESTVSISGLQDNFGKAVELFEHLVRNCKPDDVALEGLKNRLLRTRANTKLNKNAIMAALRSYGTYGSNNPSNYTLSNDEIKNLKASDLVDILHSLLNYQHKIIYYGPMPLADLTAGLKKWHSMPAAWTAAPPALKFPRTAQTSNQVLFADYDMVQAEIYWIRNLEAYDARKEAQIDLFNGYFGSGIGSIVFQVIRESKALAYSTQASLLKPTKKEDNFSFIAYVGSQADKLNDAITGMNELLNDMPETKQTFEDSRKGTLKDYETDRITKENIVFTYLSLQKKGIDHDLRKDIYEQMKTMKFEDIKK